MERYLYDNCKHKEWQNYKVVSREEEKSTLTESDSEMDERAVEAVKAAINKAKICKNLQQVMIKKKAGLCRVCEWGKKVCRIENR